MGLLLCAWISPVSTLWQVGWFELTQLPLLETARSLSLNFYLLQTVQQGHAKHSKPVASEAEFPEIGFLFLINPELHTY